MNRSMPASSIIPVLAYEDVRQAAAWLVHAFGFAERLRIGDHRIQLTFGDGAVVVTGGGDKEGAAGHSIMVRVEKIDLHFASAQQHGAQIINPPTDYPYGERQYTARDIGGHIWTFSQTIADVDPASWGGVLLG